jgi:hypothetical protein
MAAKDVVGFMSHARPGRGLPTTIRQRHSGTAAREQLADGHKTVAVLPTVAAVASE